MAPRVSLGVEAIFTGRTATLGFEADGLTTARFDCLVADEVAGGDSLKASGRDWTITFEPLDVTLETTIVISSSLA